MDWITEHIAIGNFIDAKSVSKDEVDAILCVINDCCSEDNEIIDVMCLPLVDGAGNDRRHFNDAVDFIDDVVSSNEKNLSALSCRKVTLCLYGRQIFYD